MNDIIIRRETTADFPQTEYITREAFWNVYRPGCFEHYVLHNFRSDPDFIPELSCVAELSGRLVGHIMYARAQVTADSGAHIPICVFGPVSVLPELQGKGIGAKLIEYTLALAAKMGFGAVAITGDPAYYARFGFVPGSSLGIYYDGMPRSEESPFFMVKELLPGFLSGVCGVYSDPKGYTSDPAAVDVFDAAFPKKEKKVLPGQLG